LFTKLIPIDRAKSEIEKLQYYVNLDKSYQFCNTEQEIVKNYRAIKNFAKDHTPITEKDRTSTTRWSGFFCAKLPIVPFFSLHLIIYLTSQLNPPSWQFKYLVLFPFLNI
jgi:hypothetical protein